MNENLIAIPAAQGDVSAILRAPETVRPIPLVLHGPGWMSSKAAAHYVPYHTEFAANGIATLVVDYRSMSRESELIDPRSMVEDLLSAVDHASALPFVDAERIVLLGTGGVGAGAAIAAGARSRVAAVAAVSPIASGESWLSFMRTPEQMAALLERVARDRTARERGDAATFVSPIGDISIPPAERAQIGFKEEIADAVPHLVRLETVERLLDFRPIDDVAAIAPRELLLVACRDDVAVRFEDAAALRARAVGPSRLVVLESTSSYRMHKTHWQQIAHEVIDLVGRLPSEQLEERAGES